MKQVMINIAVLLFVFLYAAVPVYAEETVTESEATLDLKKRILLDGTEYTPVELIADFIEAAFSETMWNEETGEDKGYFFENQVSHFKVDRTSPLYKKYDEAPSGIKNRIPWIAPYVQRTEGLPLFGHLTKWEKKEITIGLDWPLYGTEKLRKVNANDLRQDVFEWSDYTSTDPQKTYALLTAILNEIIPDIEDATGVKIKLQQPQDRIERTKDYAKIRIVPKATLTLENFFRSYRDHPRHYAEKLVAPTPTTEFALTFGGVTFAPYQRAQVDGYYYPEVNGEIGLSICKVFPAVGREMLKALLNECLVRSMGLPGVVENKKHAFLGAWNSAYDPYSKLPAFEGLDARIKLEGITVEEARKNFEQDKDALKFGTILNRARGRAIADPADFPRVEKDMSAYAALSDYDKFMLRLLYCEDIKPNMDRYAVMAVLVKSHRCWQK